MDDNKGADVTSLFLMRYLQKAHPSLGIRLICGTDEEVGMGEMQLLKENGYAFPALSLVPDPGFFVNNTPEPLRSFMTRFQCPCGTHIIVNIHKQPLNRVPCMPPVIIHDYYPNRTLTITWFPKYRNSSLLITHARDTGELF